MPNDEDRKLLLLVESWQKSTFLSRVRRVFFRDGLQVSDRQEGRIAHILNALLFYSKGEYYEDYIENKQDKTFSYRPMIRKFMTVKFLRKAVREYDVRNKMVLCRKVLKYYIKKELEFYADKFNENMPFPSRIEDIKKEIAGGDMFLSMEPVDVIRRVLPAAPPLDGLRISQAKYDNLIESGAFYVEKYATVVTNNQTTPDHFASLHGINRISDVQDRVDSYTGNKNVYVSDVFGTARVLGSGRRRNNEEEETGKPTPKSQKEKRDERKQKRKERREERAEDRERRREEQANGYAGSIGIRIGLRLMFCPPPEMEPISEPEPGGVTLPVLPTNLSLSATPLIAGLNSEPESEPESGDLVMANLSNIESAASAPLQQLFGGLSGGYFNVDGTQQYYNSMGDSFPLLSYERDIKNVRLKDLRLNAEDLDCYMDELFKSRGLKFFFNSLLPTRRAASMVAIYCYDGFVQSVGLGDDEREEGEEGSRGRWRQKLLKRTKRNLYHMFVSNLKSMSNRKDKFDDGGERSAKRFRRKRFPKQLQNIDKGAKWWQLRKKVGRPFDKNGNPKIDIVNTLFGD
jgi:hypothetical protein